MVRLSESQYSQLYKYAVHVAYYHTQNRDVSLDIVQNAFLSMLSVSSDVKSPFMWMRTTIKHEYIKQSQKESKQQSIAKEAFINKPARVEIPLEDEDAILSIPEEKICEYLSKDDFGIYQTYKQAGFRIKKYAALAKLPYNTAREHKKKIKRNLLAKYLWDQGWRCTKKILTYNQYNQIKRFINHLLQYVKSKKTLMLQHYVTKDAAPQIEELFADVADLREWMTAPRDGFLLVTLVCNRTGGGYKFLYIRIVFDDKNIIHIIKAHEPPILAQIKGKPGVLEPYREKGKIMLTHQQIINVVSGKQIKE